jgi:hypothetical protein
MRIDNYQQAFYKTVRESWKLYVDIQRTLNKCKNKMKLSLTLRKKLTKILQ